MGWCDLRDIAVDLFNQLSHSNHINVPITGSRDGQYVNGFADMLLPNRYGIGIQRWTESDLNYSFYGLDDHHDGISLGKISKLYIWAVVQFDHRNKALTSSPSLANTFLLVCYVVKAHCLHKLTIVEIIVNPITIMLQIRQFYYPLKWSDNVVIVLVDYS